MSAIAGRVADALGRALAALARAADRLLDAVGLAPPLLDLPAQVHRDLREFFGGTVDPATVTIRRGHVPGVPHSRAFALPGLIYLGADPGVVGIPYEGGPETGHPETGQPPPGPPTPGGVRPRATPTLVHELTHIWQGRVLGPRYVVRALGEQVRLGRRAYDWRAVLEGAAPSVRRSEWPVEAHAQLVSEAYAASLGFSPATAPAGRDGDRRVMELALTGLRAGRAPTLRGLTG